MKKESNGSLPQGACCPDCGTRLHIQNGCAHCPICGWAACGG
ncbi:hypothetical protein [Geovibrio ferrireducens]|nr:hypothetical protein [Geovibrio ferrireducens]